MTVPKRSVTEPEQPFARIFDAHAPFVLRVMRHLGVPSGDLQDQCQEVFVAVFRGLPGFAGRSSVQTWLYGICLRVASNHRRRAYVRRERSFAEVPEPPTSAHPDEPLEHRLSACSLQGYLDALDPNQREVFVLYELEDLSMKQVAEICGCPLQTAYSRLHAARRALLEKHRQSEAQV